MEKSLNVSEFDQSKKVSFVVPVYKTEEYLEKSLKSLLDQDYKNIEIVCVLDGDSKKARKIIEKLRKEDARILPTVIIPHGGAPKARNEGYKYTTGDYVSFWDSDCYAEIGMTRMWVKTFNLYNVDFVYSGYRFTDDQFMPSEYFNPYLLTCNNYIATMFPMKREIFPYFDESLESLQDWDMWLTITERGFKGWMLEGAAFKTEIREGISSKNCTNEVWLERYNRVREKHKITGRDVCFTSQVARLRGQQIAEMFKQDYKDMPSFKPHEYKLIYCIGFYFDTMQQSTATFKDAPKDCKKAIHWLGSDIEDIMMRPYRGVKALMDMVKQAVNYHTCEDEQTAMLLKEFDIEAKVISLPMGFEDVKTPDTFKVYFEADQPAIQFAQEIITACPDIKFESFDEDKKIDLNDYACFMSFTFSQFPSENMKKFLSAGRYAVTNYKMPYAGYVEPEKEKAIRKIRETYKLWKKHKVNTDAMKYYQELINPDKFGEHIDSIKGVAK